MRDVKMLRAWLWLTPFLCLLCSAAIIELIVFGSHRIKDDPVSYAMSWLMYPMWLIFLITGILVKDGVQDLQKVPDAVHISLLLRSMRYIYPRRYAWLKLIKIIPETPFDELKSVRPKLWKRFYRYARLAEPKQKHFAFDIAQALEDRQAVPYLEKAFYSGVVPADERDELLDVIKRLA